ncbi:MBL fold metallo-hydrolase [Leifsonia sp. NPDC058194]
MLSTVAPGVSVHESTFCQSNTVVVEGAGGVLLVDPGSSATSWSASR